MGHRLMALAMIAALAGCSAAVPSGAGQRLKGEIKIDGSSTVFLITEAMATNFKQLHPDVNITIGSSGTGGGFKKFASGETDVNDASRPIKPIEAEACKKHGIAYTDLQVGWDGIAVVINPQNDWARQMTLDQLKKIWHPNTDSFKNARFWSEVDPSWPKVELDLYGPGTDSGTFDFFTDAVNGKERVSRSDYHASEDDNNLVQGVARNKGALGYFGVAFYEVNKKALTAVALAKKTGDPYVVPEANAVLTRTYSLSRPLFIYVRDSSLKRPEIQEFVTFFLRRGDLVRDAKYVDMTTRQRVAQQDKLAATLHGLR